MTPTLLITRPQPAADSFASAVIAALQEDVPVVISPALQIVPLDPGTIPAPAHVVFTSVHGVAQAVRLGVTKVPAWCVGDKTAAAARAAGFDATSAGGAANDLIALVIDRAPNGPMLHLAGRHHRGDIAAKLSQAGFQCTTIATYLQDLLPPTETAIALARGTKPVVAPVFSPRSSHILNGLEWHGPLHVIAISGAVAEEMAHMGCDTVQTASQPTEAAMITATARQLRAILDR